MKLDKQIRSWMNISKVGSTEQKLDQQSKSWINRSKARLTKQVRPKIRSTAQMLDQEIKR